ncbi:MAG: glutamyl-tRNA reductase [Brumimicrobium sp.]|nr:glutamyl-tRNA reductase [Brumimicrobium sp.]
MDEIHIFAFTHRQLEVNQIGWLHIAPDNQKERLSELKARMGISELMFLSTCNRVEFVICSERVIDVPEIKKILGFLYPEFNEEKISLFANAAEYFNGKDAVEHLIKVTSSVDSMIIGEREIITQVRKAFQLCKGFGITGDTIRLLIRHTIETAKKIYTETNIAQRPVSVVSLAYHTLRRRDVSLDARVVVIGAGITNTNMCRFLKKHGFQNFSVFNRSAERAERLAENVGGRAFSLNDLHTFQKGFDVLITCTGSESSIITEEIYNQLLNNDKSNKIIIDLAIPSDLDENLLKSHSIDYISVNYLQQISSKNLQQRAREIIHVEEIITDSVKIFEEMFRERQIELAMKEVPAKVKEIKSIALERIFAKEMEMMDEHSKETVQKIIDYLEKKYISVPMKMAKEILLKK